MLLQRQVLQVRDPLTNFSAVKGDVHTVWKEDSVNGISSNKSI